MEEEEIDYIITVKAIDDIQNSSETRVVAKKGRKGVMIADWEKYKIGTTKYVSIRWEGNKISNNTPAWKLEIIDERIK